MEPLLLLEALLLYYGHRSIAVSKLSNVDQSILLFELLNYLHILSAWNRLTMNATANFTNASLSCFRVKCQFTVGERVAIIFFFTTIFLASLVGNCILFLAIIRNKRLRRSSTNFSILNLSLANILITIFCIPVFTIDTFIAERWVFGVIGCKLVIFLQNTSINAAILTLLALSVEKFVAVYFPFYVRSQRTKVRYLVVGAWIVGIIHSSVYLSYKTVKTFQGIPLCVENWPSHSTRKIFVVVQAIVLRFVPLTFMIVLHAVTIKRIKERLQYRRKARKNDEGSFRESDMMQVSSHGLKIRKKAVTMLVIIVATAAVTLFPYYIYVCWRMLANPKITDFFANNVAVIVTTWLVYFNSVCHPIIFGMMSTQYRKAAKTLSSRKSQTHSRTLSNTKKQIKQEPMLMTAQGSGSG